MSYRDFKDRQQLLIKYCVIKHLILLKIQNMMDIKEVSPQRFIIFLIKTSAMRVRSETLAGSGIKMRIFQIKN